MLHERRSPAMRRAKTVELFRDVGISMPEAGSTRIPSSCPAGRQPR
jgi:hypothetical protein